MARGSTQVSKPVFHAPMLLDWSDEKLKSLSQEQLLVLLANLDHQRKIGRLNGDAATAMEQRIGALLTKANNTKRRKQLARTAADGASTQ